MKRSLFVAAVWIILLVLWASPALAETTADTAWVRTYCGPGYGWEIAYAVALDGSQNACVTGFSLDPVTGEDYATVRYYPNGNVAWSKRYNGPGNGGDRAYAVATDDMGNVYVTGRSLDNGTYLDFATIKYDSDGDTAWVRRCNGPADSTDEARAIAVDGFGNVYVTGFSYGGTTGYDYLTVKYCPDGATAWLRRYNGTGNDDDRAYAVAVDGDGSVYVFGQSKGIGTDYDYVTIKYHFNGDTAWVRRYNGPGSDYDRASAMAIDDYGNVYVTGWTLSATTDRDYATIKYLPDGDTAWVRIYDGAASGWDAAYAIAVDGLGNVYVTGESEEVGTYGDYATVKYNPNGDTLWVGRYNGPGDPVDYPYAIAVDGSGNVYVTGESGADYLTVRYDPGGETDWVQRYDGPANSGDGAEAIVVDDSGNVYVTGSSDGTGTGNYDYATIKYVQFMRGDASGDLIVDVGDVVYLVNYLYRNGPAPQPLAAGDANCDGVVDLGDIVFLLSYLFRGGAPPGC